MHKWAKEILECVKEKAKAIGIDNFEGQNLDDLKAGARIDIDENKRNPYDFVLWFTKSKFENQALVWDSPWGRGYPGWHIECSAMSMKYLGEEIDIHTGGIDHIPIHHTNEIAQSEGATGHKWVHYWLHNEFLVINKGKMSKSQGNFLTLQSLIDKGYDPLDYRYFLLGAHYRSQIMFSWEAMDSAKNTRKSLEKTVKKLLSQIPEGQEDSINADKELTSPEVKKAMESFSAALAADLSTPKALASMWSLVKTEGVPVSEILSGILVMDKILGIGLEEMIFDKTGSNSGIPAEEIGEIEQLVQERQEQLLDSLMYY